MCVVEKHISIITNFFYGVVTNIWIFYSNFIKISTNNIKYTLKRTGWKVMLVIIILMFLFIKIISLFTLFMITITHIIISYGIIKSLYYKSDFYLQKVIMPTSDNFADTFANLYIYRPVGLVIKTYYLVISRFIRGGGGIPIKKVIFGLSVSIVVIVLLSLVGISKLYFDVLMCTYNTLVQTKSINMKFILIL